MNARKVPSVMDCDSASNPPAIRISACPAAGTACIAGVNRLVIRARRSRDRYNSRASAASPSNSCRSWPNPFTTRTPATAASTRIATSAARACASQLAGKSFRWLRLVMIHKAGTTSSAISVRAGDISVIRASAPASSTTLPATMGMSCRNIWISVTSVIARLTTCPVRSSACSRPSSRSSAANRSRRRSCCTPSDSCEEATRRVKDDPNRAAPATSSSAAHGATDAAVVVSVSITWRTMRGSTAVSSAAASAPAPAVTTRRRCSRQRRARYRIHPGWERPGVGEFIGRPRACSRFRTGWPAGPGRSGHAMWSRCTRCGTARAAAGSAPPGRRSAPVRRAAQRA